MTNMSQTNQPPVSSLIQQRRLKLFGHIARAAASEDHSRALRASTDRLPVDSRLPRGRPRQSWLRTIESDLKPLNLGLHSALRRATDRPSWRRIVETAMLFRACHQMMMMKDDGLGSGDSWSQGFFRKYVMLPSSSEKWVTYPLMPTKMGSLQRQQNSF